MKALFITHSFPREPGDAPGSFVLRLAVALRDEDVQVRVIAPSADRLPRVDVLEGITVERFRYAPRRFENLAYTGNMATQVSASWAAKVALVGFLGAEFGNAVRTRRAFEPDIVHAHWWFPGGLVGSWLGSLANVPLVTTLHGTDVRLANGVSVARTLFRHVVKHSHAVTAVSRWLASTATQLAPGLDVQVAPMPVATDLFTPAGERESATFLFVGRLNRQKGIEDLLRALAQTRAGASLDVVGHGPDHDALRALASELGISERVRWHGALPQPAVVPLYRRATALVAPSVGEGLGLVAVEALLCETPVIAYESGGLTDIVQHGQTGLLVAPSDVGALAAALDTIVAMDDQGRDMGRAGRMVALSRFAPESAARRYAGIYRSVIGERPA